MATLQEAIAIETARLQALLAAAVPATGLAALPLPTMNNLPVDVMRVPAALLAGVAGQVADGTVMRDSSRYVIFLCDPPNPGPPGVGAAEMERYYVLHEYEHVARGHVFLDDPARLHPLYESAQIAAQEPQVVLAGAARYICDALTRGAVIEAAAIKHHFGL